MDSSQTETLLQQERDKYTLHLDLASNECYIPTSVATSFSENRRPPHWQAARGHQDRKGIQGNLRSRSNGSGQSRRTFDSGVRRRVGWWGEWAAVGRGGSAGAARARASRGGWPRAARGAPGRRTRAGAAARRRRARARPWRCRPWRWPPLLRAAGGRVAPLVRAAPWIPTPI